MPSRSITQRKSVRVGMSIIAVLGVIGLSGCTLNKVDSDDSGSSQSSEVKQESMKPVASVHDGESGVSVTDPITVKAGDKLKDVSLTASDGTEIKGETKDSGKEWNSTEPLDFGQTYTLKASAGDEKVAKTFSTLSPDYLAEDSLQPLDGSTVGIGQVVGLRFDTVIQDREAVEKAISITTEPKVEGAFYWITNQEVRWRPENFWKPGTKVTVNANLYGKDLGGGVYGASNRNATFTIGDAVIATADDNTKTMTIERNGVVEKTMPISMGSPQYPTPNGTYFLGDHNPSMIMDSSTFGLAVGSPGGYRSEVQYATQMSYSGIYVHSAPWSIGDQGVRDVSHGCLNVSPENAQWFLNNTLRGDIVIVKNTVGGQIEGTDGLTDWNIPWETWKKGNAKG